MIMLDTNICLYVLKAHPISVLKAFETAKALQFHLSYTQSYGQVLTKAQRNQK